MQSKRLWAMAPLFTVLVFALSTPLPAQRPPQQPAPEKQPPPATPAPAEDAAPASSAIPPPSPRAAAWAILNEGLSSTHVPIRTEAISALATIGPTPEASRLVEARLQDTNLDVRQAAASALGDMKARSTIPALRKALSDPAPAVSFTAAKSLWEMHDYSGRDIFLAILSGERKASPGIVRGELQDAKRRMDNPGALALIGANEAAGALLGPFSIGLTIAEALHKDSASPARAVAAHYLGMEKSDAEARDELLDALADKNWVVRAAAARALGNSAQPRLITQLRPLLDDPKQPVRLMAAASIVRLSDTAHKSPARANTPKNKAPAAH